LIGDQIPVPGAHRGRRDGQPEASFTLAQGRFCLLAVSNIRQRPRKGDRISPLIVFHLTTGNHPALLAIAAVEPKFFSKVCPRRDRLLNRGGHPGPVISMNRRQKRLYGES